MTPPRLEMSQVTYKPPEIPEEGRKIAKKFFQHAATVADTRNYDYAIELFIQGLAKDPEAVDAGHKPLRDAGLKRLMLGGKKVGFLESLKRGSATKKDPTAAFLNAEYLLAKDPLNAAHAETLVKNLDAAECPEALEWALGVLLELACGDKKSTAARFLAITEFYEKLGDYYEKLDQTDRAIHCFEAGVNTLEAGTKAKDADTLDLMSKQRNLAGKLTILRGKYERAEGFRESIRDVAAQKELQDKTRVYKSEELLEQTIDRARRELQENPDVAGKINIFADALLQRATPQDEAEAIDVLQGAFDRTRQYAFKLRADDIRIRQMARAVKELKDQAEQDPNPELKARLETEQKRLEEFEIAAYSERVKEYPTDARIKFELGRRLHKARRFDDAIPVFQEAQIDPKHTVRAKYFIGTCFFHKGWYQQAIDVLTEAAANYEITGDNFSKDLHYILGRTYESADRKDLALKTYSKLIQWDFNYRDVRNRIDKLQKESRA